MTGAVGFHRARRKKRGHYVEEIAPPPRVAAGDAEQAALVALNAIETMVARSSAATADRLSRVHLQISKRA